MAGRAPDSAFIVFWTYLAEFAGSRQARRTKPGGAGNQWEQSGNSPETECPEIRLQKTFTIFSSALLVATCCWWSAARGRPAVSCLPACTQ